MFPLKAKSIAEIESKTYPLGEKIEHPADDASLALVALSHTPVERRLYAAMLAARPGAMNADNEQLENGLRALADYIRARNPAPGGTSPAVHDEPVSAEGANYKIIRDLLSTYRAGAGTETTLPLRSEEETSER